MLKLHFSYFSFFLLVIMLLLNGCSSMRDAEPGYSRVHLSDHKRVTQLLYAQYKEWNAVRYRLGGLSKAGVDCSGFVFLTYRERFGVDLPRDTDKQADAGRKIGKSALQSGDLVFFKTGFAKRHVGMYVENGTFLHASTAHGVMLSRMDEPYWQKTFWKSVRL